MNELDLALQKEDYSLDERTKMLQDLDSLVQRSKYKTVTYKIGYCNLIVMGYYKLTAFNLSLAFFTFGFVYFAGQNVDDEYQSFDDIPMKE